MLANLDIGTIQIDRRVVDKPALLRLEIKDDSLLATHLQQLPLEGTIGLRVEIFDALSDAQLRSNGSHPARLVEDTINGGPKTEEIEGRSLVERGKNIRIVHGVRGVVMLDAIFSLDSIATTKAANAAISTAGLKPPATI